ncbi:hypothetical protein C7974DRAFT_454094 [Boeremia exigua]|uniref:uncharacterized protein n=1 Tax=Boeremia exigua TaxID=749465 RepID=UPI001E8EB5DC|nr:uncharacterized protein C7974DRAFT_454094 [Boeremia exigua]KAH6629374.1 hypothetical protein C7974DRAFT_454094 [Boeremia exigua]
MASKYLSDKDFHNGFADVHDLFTAGKLEECETEAFAFLAEEAIPKYYRMKTLILLGIIVGDWEEANRYYVAADHMWHTVRGYHPEGTDKDVEESITEIRECLDSLRVALQEDALSECGLTITGGDIVEEHDADIEDACAEMDDLELEDARAEMDGLELDDAHVHALGEDQPQPQLSKPENPKQISLSSLDNVCDPGRQAPPDSPVMMPANCEARQNCTHLSKYDGTSLASYRTIELGHGQLAMLNA